MLALATLGVASAVIAGVVIFYSGASTRSAEQPEAKVRTHGNSLVVGSPAAPTKVEVYEDFGNRQSRDFETASRDFLRIEAAQHKVVVEYAPFPRGNGYSRRAIEVWGAVLETGTPKEALALHDELFDQQPTAGSADPSPSDLEAWAVDAGVGKALAREAAERPDTDFAGAARKSVSAAGIQAAPTVLLNGKPVEATSGVLLADQLQRKILAD
jgi:protein-disulfide isomerase